MFAPLGETDPDGPQTPTGPLAIVSEESKHGYTPGNPKTPKHRHLRVRCATRTMEKTLVIREGVDPYSKSNVDEEPDYNSHLHALPARGL
jgi:hypothetical protein